MRMNAPKVLTWLVSLILGAAGILLKLNVIYFAELEKYDFTLLAVGFCLLALGNLIKEL